jgi:hypothetical protein
MPNKKLLWLVTFSVFLVAYFFYITHLFSGYKHAKIFDDIPDLLIALVAFMILLQAVGSPDKKSKRLLVAGSIFVIVNKLLQVPVQEFQNMNHVIVPLYVWFIVDINLFIGIPLILIGFKEAHTCDI